MDFHHSKFSITCFDYFHGLQYSFPLENWALELDGLKEGSVTPRCLPLSDKPTSFLLLWQLTPLQRTHEGGCCDLPVLPPLNSYVEILRSNVVVLEGGTFGRWFDHESGTLLNGVSVLIKEAWERPLPLLPCEDIRSLWPARADNDGTLVLTCRLQNWKK